MDHANSAPNAGSASRYGTDMVEIFVGPKAERHLIHKKPLCDTARYFDTMFNGPFKETVVQKCSEPEADPVGFNIFIHVVYAGELPKDIWDGKHNGDCVIKFYILCDKYLVDEDIMDMALEAMIVPGCSRCEDGVDANPTISQRAVQAALMSLDAGDRMGRLVIDLVCEDYMTDRVDDEWVAEVLESVPAKAAVQLMRTLKDNSRWSYESSEVSTVLVAARKYGILKIGRYSRKGKSPKGTKRKATISDPEPEDDEESDYDF